MPDRTVGMVEGDPHVESFGQVAAGGRGADGGPGPGAVFRRSMLRRPPRRGIPTTGGQGPLRLIRPLSERTGRTGAGGPTDAVVARFTGPHAIGPDAPVDDPHGETGERAALAGPGIRDLRKRYGHLHRVRHRWPLHCLKQGWS